MSNYSIDTTRVSFLTVTSANDGQRLDNFLINILKGAPKALIYRIIRKGEVRINKGRVKADSRIQIGDVVRVPPLRLAAKEDVPEVSKALAELLTQAVIYEDEGLLVVNKPHGLAVHGGSGVSLGLIEALRKLRPSYEFLELVHRLDRDTSGIILVAKKRSVLTALQRMLVNKQGITKRYLALVHGSWPHSVQQVNLPLKRIERQSGERMVIVADDGKTALTRTQLVSQGRHYSLIEAEPVTGRTHQIRVHCQSQGLSIAGDVKYCDTIQQGIDKKHQIKRLCLHAQSLSFRHPLSGEQLSLQAPLDEELSTLITQVGCHV